ncbi:TetR/AcrR family transcriptional regulator [Streptococcus sp. KCJ4932]|uniref:TetR/AcrR family transcriptional regulator n=1 Tax=Streptococcus sp. KCJ4932 TaxID=2545465 RepID=UPI001055034A|nr:TetR/AcrR family transcriptional regulator [Streptococcus sp. KCJ4932]TDE68694.1 TetR/AcrR family transcriptional regulator [Streptococcus sp. KCJ4932]
MSKGFTPEEKSAITTALIDAFEDELRFQKINKITVDELVKKVGISKGSFYNFFPSKEILFFHVVTNIQQKLITEIVSIVNKKQQPNKKKLKLILLLISERLQNYPWIHELDGVEFEKVLRKLPQNLKETLISQDIIDVENILEQLHLESTIPTSRLVVMIQIILFSTIRAKDFGKQYNNALKTIIDSLVDNFFDEK